MEVLFISKVWPEDVDWNAYKFIWTGSLHITFVWVAYWDTICIHTGYNVTKSCSKIVNSDSIWHRETFPLFGWCIFKIRLIFTSLTEHTQTLFVGLVRRKPQQAKHKYQIVLPKKEDHFCNKACVSFTGSWMRCCLWPLESDVGHSLVLTLLSEVGRQVSFFFLFPMRVWGAGGCPIFTPLQVK